MMLSGLHGFELNNFELQTLVIDSQMLKGNPLGDSPKRRCPVLIPKGSAPSEGWPLVLILAGFSGNGPNYLNIKTFESNAAEVLDRAVGRDAAPQAIYVFCDAMTFWGGSQFIDSSGTGRYASYILNDLLGELEKALPVSRAPEQRCVAGGSSGGYGALHLSTLRPDLFGIAVAIAPDSFFEASLLAEIRTAWPAITALGGVAGVKAELQAGPAGRLLKRKDVHTILNAVAMGVCYAPDHQGAFHLPIHADTGALVEEVWEKWLAHDPIHFVVERAASAQRLRHVYLDVGIRDQFHLQYGTRQVRNRLKDLGVSHSYREFDGTHFDIGERRLEAWTWLNELWT